MRTTIDKAGRVVIPAAVRAQAGLRAGTELEVEVQDDGVRLAPVGPRPRLVRRKGRLVAVPTAPTETLPAVDVPAMVREERDRWPV